MSTRFVAADIVLLASGHNPALVSPDWLSEKGLVTEAANQFVHTSEFSVFDSDSFLLMIDRQRLHATAKKGDTATLESLEAIGEGYVRLAPDLRCRALGINFRWVLESSAGEPIPSIITRMGDEQDLAAVFAQHEVRYGALLYATKHPYTLRLTIDPQDGNALLYNFNFHHDISGLSSDEVVERIQTLQLLSEDSREVVRRTSALEGSAE
jgi:hypothetical protein